MNPFIELMQAGALIMLLFAAVLIWVVIRNTTTGSKQRLRIGPAVIGLALLLFAIPIYAAVIGASDLNRFTTSARIAGAILLPIGLYLLGSREEGLPVTTDRDDDE